MVQLYQIQKMMKQSFWQLFGGQILKSFWKVNIEKNAFSKQY